MTEDIDFEYYCYRCGAKNQITLPCPTAPEFHHSDLQCRSCGDGTRIILSHCPSCSRFIYWIDDLSIPDLVTGFARYMVHNMQTMIDQAALQGATIEIDTHDKYPISANCPCGKKLTIEISIPDLD